MESKKINQLATNVAPVSSDLTIIGDPTTGVSKKVTLLQIANLFAGAVDFYANLAAFPATGVINTIYCAKDTQKLYLWSGSAYVETFPSQAVLNTYQLLSAKGVANGYASLDASGKVPIGELPSSIMEYKGLWSAATNTPTLADGTGDTGDVYICSAAGTVNFGAGGITFAVGDYVIYSGTIWQRSSGAVGTVTSVGLSSATSGVTIGSTPVTTSGTITLAIATATTSQNGLLSSTDWATFNGKESVLTFSSPLVRTTNTISIPAATTSVNGYLVSADFTTFNNKQNAITLTTTGSSGVSTLVGATLNIPNYGSVLTGYVPYTGATQDVDLGAFKLNAQSLHIKGTAGNGHLGLKHQSASATALANEVSLFADSLGDLSWQNGNLYLSKFIISSNTANRSYTFPNANGTVALTSDISYPVSSVFGRTGAVVATEGDYSLTQLSDVTITTPSTGQVLKYNGTAWVNDSDTDTGITSLNGLTATTQTFAVGTSGTDFAISSATSTHTFNLPTASAANRGALSSADWTTFNNKQSTLSLTTTGNSGLATLVSNTLNVPTYTLAGLGGISLTSLSATTPLSYNNTTGAFSIQVANTSQDGYLSSTDWNTFNGKQNTITNPVTGTGTSGQVTYFNGTSSVTSSSSFKFDGTNLTIGNPSSALAQLHIYNAAAAASFLLQTNSTTDYSEIAVRNNSSTATSYFRQYSTATTSSDFGVSRAGLAMFFSNYATNFVVGTRNGGDLIFGTNDIERARVLSSNGYFGLGTSTPSYLLDVNGTGRFTGALTIGTDFAQLLPISASNYQLLVGNYYDGTNIIATATSGSRTIYNVGGMDFRTFTGATVGSSVTDTSRLTIASTGAATFSSSVTATSATLSQNTNAIIDILTLYNVSATSAGVRQRFQNGFGDLAAISVSQRDNGSLADDGQMEFQVASNSVLDTKMTILNNGVVTITNLGTGTVTATSGVLSAVSDMNLKIEDGYIDNALDKILKLTPRYFYWKEETGLPTDLRQLGFFAQEVNEVLGEEVANTPKTENDKWGIYDRGIIAMLVKSIQELEARLKTIENK